jgi:ABC-type glycerol-3-phosphate transport system substrate-binding protein
MMRRFGLFILLFCAGCGNYRITFVTDTPKVASTLQASPTPPEDASPPEGGSDLPAGDATPAPRDTLRLWVPPAFDPAANTPAAELLRARLSEFQLQQPNLRIEIRVKAVDGTGGMLNALSATSAAAPQSLPDLIALPRGLLEAAALKGLLHPYEDFTVPLAEADWYPYARQLARIENSTFGLPFAGDALMLVYRPQALPEAPRNWDSALQLSLPLVFPAADAQAWLPLAFYLSANGRVQDDLGRPALDLLTLTQVLTFTQSAAQAGMMPVSMTLLTQYDQAWTVFGEQNAPYAAAWVSRYLTAQEDTIAPSLLPTPTGKAFALTYGWAWAVASPDPETQKLAASLAEFLTDATFLGRWCAAIGALPPRANALEGWSDRALQSFLDEIAASAQLTPSADVAASVAPVLTEAWLQVMKAQSSPSQAAEQAVRALNSP